MAHLEVVADSVQRFLKVQPSILRLSQFSSFRRRYSVLSSLSSRLLFAARVSVYREFLEEPATEWPIVVSALTDVFQRVVHGFDRLLSYLTPLEYCARVELPSHMTLEDVKFWASRHRPADGAYSLFVYPAFTPVEDCRRSGEKAARKQWRYHLHAFVFCEKASFLKKYESTLRYGGEISKTSSRPESERLDDFKSYMLGTHNSNPVAWVANNRPKLMVFQSGQSVAQSEVNEFYSAYEELSKLVFDGLLVSEDEVAELRSDLDFRRYVESYMRARIPILRPRHYHYKTLSFSSAESSESFSVPISPAIQPPKKSSAHSVSKPRIFPVLAALRALFRIYSVLAIVVFLAGQRLFCLQQGSFSRTVFQFFFFLPGRPPPALFAISNQSVQCAGILVYGSECSA